jgi:DNA-binding HxlR family transcriptional regulator
MYILYLVLLVNLYKLLSELFHTRCGATNKQLALGEGLRKLVEARIDHTLKGIEETLECIMKEQEIGLEGLKADVQSLGESFSLLSRKWNLEILYTLFLKNEMSFSQLKGTLGVNSRTLSDKMKSMVTCGCVERRVKPGPPLRVGYLLTVRGRELVLLALPLLYYSREHAISGPDPGGREREDDAGFET